MHGYLQKQSRQIDGNNENNLLEDALGGLRDGLQFGAKIGANLLKDTIGKVAPLG
jgi:hypothetical protein